MQKFKFGLGVTVGMVAMLLLKVAAEKKVIGVEKTPQKLSPPRQARNIFPGVRHVLAGDPSTEVREGVINELAKFEPADVMAPTTIDDYPINTGYTRYLGKIDDLNAFFYSQPGFSLQIMEEKDFVRTVIFVPINAKGEPQSPVAAEAKKGEGGIVEYLPPSTSHSPGYLLVR